MSSIELVIFDCDGVLVDSEPIANEVLRDALHELGWSLTIQETQRRFIGRSMTAVVHDIEQYVGRRLPESWLAELESVTFERFRQELHPIEGVAGALDRIACRTCVASSGSHAKMRVTLSKTGLWDHFVGRIFSADDVKRGKPAPDLFQLAASVMQADPSRTVVVEDSAPGVEAAVAAGMRPIGFCQRGQDDDLESRGARIVNRMTELPGVIATI